MLAQDKQTAHIMFVALVPVGFSRLSIAFFNHVTDQLQRTKKEVALLTWSSHKKLTE